VRKVTDAYRQSYDRDPQDALRRIHDAFVAELSSPTDTPTAGLGRRMVPVICQSRLAGRRALSLGVGGCKSLSDEEKRPGYRNGIAKRTW
jgi:hypothetical protein